MATGRKLSVDEKKAVHDYAIGRARSAYPNAMVTVVVEDHLDENGKTNWRIAVVEERLK